MGRSSPGSGAVLVLLLALIFGVSGAWDARIFPGATQNCSQQGLTCSISISSCLDPGWLDSHSYTPSAPDRLDLRILTRLDPRGNELPVLSASWRLKDDGSILFLKASELHVVTVSTNQNLCVRYSVNSTLPMRDPSGNQWTFSSDMVVLDPGQSYRVSVENIPKAELDHSTSSLSRDLTVPDCSDPVMKRTQPCIESGYSWSPNISLSQSGSVLTVEFSPDPFCHRYFVLVRCGTTGNTEVPTRAGNSSRLSASFSLDFWRCCRLRVEVLSHFPRCGNDCRRHRKSIDICRSSTPTKTPEEWRPLPVALGASALVLLLLGVCVTVAVCRRRGREEVLQAEELGLFQKQLEEHPTLLLIYSRDHPLYLHVVLKLAAFLQAQCGILVLLDLLDSSSVSQYGVFRWLELQRQKLGPSDKILVLCSRGVQSRWRAMCGLGQVVQQPDDLIGPFLSLFLSDMHTPGSRGRYIAAFFEDLSSEQDVPSFFDISVKYKLMKHFEELYFRILDLEKYEPRRINHVQGIGPDEYHRCSSGRSLQSAVHAFAAFQSCHPDWFQNAEDAGESGESGESELLIENVHVLPRILECSPVVQDAAPILVHDVLPSETAPLFYIAEPEVKQAAPISLNEPLPPPPDPDRVVLELQPEPRPHPHIFTSELVPNVAPRLPEEDDEEGAESGVESGEGVGQKVVWAESGAGHRSEEAESGVESEEGAGHRAEEAESGEEQNVVGAKSGMGVGQNMMWAESGMGAGQNMVWAESGMGAGQNAAWAESGAGHRSEGAESGVGACHNSDGAESGVSVERVAGSKGQSSASDQGYSSRVWTEPDSGHMAALLRLQQELMGGYCDFHIE